MASAMAAASRRASKALRTTTATVLTRTKQLQVPAGAELLRGLHTSNTPLRATHPTSVDVQGAATGVGTHTPAIIEKLARKIREIAPEQTETYRAYSRGKELYQECAKQAAYMGPGQKMKMSDRAKFWYVDCQRPHTFNSWAQVTMLHMWTLLVRFRAYPDKKKHDVWQQNFVDHFFYDAEEKMMKDYLIKSNPLRSKYLKDLFVVWRGLVAAYDEGLARHRHPLCADKISSGEAEGDAVLAAAIWRNVFDARPDTDLAMLTAVTIYTRRILSGLDKLPDEIIMEAGVVFGDPRREIEWGLEGSQPVN